MRDVTPGLAGLLLAAVAGALPGVARADPAPSMDLRGFEPTTHPEGLTRVEPTSTPGPGEWNVGAFTSYAYRPVVAPKTLESPGFVAVRNQLALDLVGGIGIADRFGVGLTLPAILFQNGEKPPAASQASPPPTAALGNAALEARGQLLKPGSFGGLGLGALFHFELPTGPKHSYVAEDETRTELRLLSELGVLGSSLRGTIGVRVRAESRTFAGHAFEDDMPWGFGIVLKPQTFGLDDAGNYALAIDAHGALALSPPVAEKIASPMALAIGARRAFGDAHAMLGVELPLDDAPGAPRVRAILGVGWAPRVHDADGDGIEDSKDQCEELPEDRDGFEDSDGCPDFDNDGDGVPDADDKCPHELEDQDGFQDEDGCPDPDDDHDGILDAVDACPREAGVADPDPKLNGCPFRDADHDGIADARDRCPHRAEDRDGFQDEDGCPDFDNDRDGVRDSEDACPNVAGPRRSDPTLNGCPSPDRDGDTFDDAVDACPDAAETFDGVSDEDGCPDAPDKPPARQPLAALEPAKGPGRPRFVLKLRAPIAFGADGELAPKSEGETRAIASLLNANPDMVLMVAVRPASAKPEAEQAALTRAFTLVGALRAYTHRDEAAEVIGWKALSKLPGATLPSGLGFLVLAPLPPPAPGTTPPVALPKEPP
ncbi:MAG TPA: thrombospondin type 3 repeat-containing protein [Polyangiaceae bacterium]|nr:thrombospondin type 3 repeat-containing protein [Polyangiaceae bacterium]